MTWCLMQSLSDRRDELTGGRPAAELVSEAAAALVARLDAALDYLCVRAARERAAETDE